MNPASASLPADAVIAVGVTHQLLVIVPSLELVAVRLGDKKLEDDDENNCTSLEKEFVQPFMRAVIRAENPELRNGVSAHQTSF